MKLFADSIKTELKHFYQADTNLGEYECGANPAATQSRTD